MVLPSRPFVPKTAGDIQNWLAREVTGGLAAETEAIAHGGTALTLLGIKDASKDVDLGFRERAHFDRFLAALKLLGYEVRMSLQPVPGEEMVRLESRSRRVDVVDIRHPTWNNWRLTPGMLAKSRTLLFGRARLILIDVATVFLFKTYPLRDTDLDDLRSVLDKADLDQSRVIRLFEEQDALHRRELDVEDVVHEPLFNVLDLRTRLAGSLRLIGPRYRRKVGRLNRHARVRFRELGLDQSLDEIVSEIRDQDRVFSWDRLLGDEIEPLRRRLALRGSTGEGSRPRSDR